ncbi:MAG: hypothetical protein ACLS6O_01510 [Bifidobacterium sp.]
MRGEDFQIVKQNGSLEAPAVFHMTGAAHHRIWCNRLGPEQERPTTPPTPCWEADPWREGRCQREQWYNNMPEARMVCCLWDDTRGTTFGSQSASVLAPGEVTSSTLVTVGIR